MKKVLLLAGVLALTVSTQCYAADDAAANLPTKEGKRIERPCPNRMHKPPMHPNKEKFENRLKLTEAQKAQAKEIHKKGFDEIKPIMDNLKLKHEEIEAVKRSSLAPEVQAEKIVQLRKECRELKRKARDIQMKNMKEFEAILTDKQKKELNKIKEEGRKKFEKAHKKGGFKMPPKDGIFPPKPPVQEEK